MIARWEQMCYDLADVRLLNLSEILEHESGIMSTYFSMLAWREILARIFDGFTLQENVSPDRLINPATRRKLKLDTFYPEANVAIRFTGLTAKGQGRQSDWEQMETQQRDQTRAELCRLNGVQMALIDTNDETVKQMDNLLQVLTRAERVLAASDLPAKERNARRAALTDARGRGEELRSLIRKQPDQMMANLAEAWRDRETNMARAVSAPVSANGTSAGQALVDIDTLAVGQRVRHSYFGDGVITTINVSDDDPTIAILFDAALEKTFLASLVQDKLEVVG